MRGEYLALGREGRNPRGCYGWKGKRKERSDVLFNKQQQSRKPGSFPSADAEGEEIWRTTVINSENTRVQKSVNKEKPYLPALGRDIDNRGQSQQTKWLKRELSQWSRYWTVGFCGWRRAARHMKDYDPDKNHSKADTQMLEKPYAKSGYQ